MDNSSLGREMITVALAIQSQASVRQGSSESWDVGLARREERRWRGQPLPSFVGENYSERDCSIGIQ